MSCVLSQRDAMSCLGWALPDDLVPTNDAPDSALPDLTVPTLVSPDTLDDWKDAITGEQSPLSMVDTGLPAVHAALSLFDGQVKAAPIAHSAAPIAEHLVSDSQGVGAFAEQAAGGGGGGTSAPGSVAPLSTPPAGALNSPGSLSFVLPQVPEMPDIPIFVPKGPPDELLDETPQSKFLPKDPRELARLLAEVAAESIEVEEPPWYSALLPSTTQVVGAAQLALASVEAGIASTLLSAPTFGISQGLGYLVLLHAVDVAQTGVNNLFFEETPLRTLTNPGLVILASQTPAGASSEENAQLIADIVEAGAPILVGVYFAAPSTAPSPRVAGPNAAGSVSKSPYNIATQGMTEAEREAVIEYARRTNAWLEQNGPVTVQSTKGALRSQANAAARNERLNAARAGQPYQWQAGHVPDTALTGQPQPPGGWLDMPGRSNNIAGGGLGPRIGRTVDRITVDGRVP